MKNEVEDIIDFKYYFSLRKLLLLFYYFLLILGDTFKCAHRPYAGSPAMPLELFPFNTYAAGARATIPFKSTVLSKEAQHHLSTESTVLIH